MDHGRSATFANGSNRPREGIQGISGSFGLRASHAHPITGYEVKLPNNPEERVRVIRKAYILDYPVSIDELTGGE